MRRRLHPEGVVSYAIGREIDCAAAMDGGTREENRQAVGCAHRLFDAIGETVEMGSTGVRLVSGRGWLDGQAKERGIEWGIEWFDGVLRGIRLRFPSLWIEALSAPEIVALAAGSGLALRETIARLRDAGMDSIAVGEPASLGVGEWINVHRAAHSLGMRTVAIMAFAVGETLQQRIDFLYALRQLQDETGGFAAFIPFAADSPNGRELDAVTAVEQLKTLAVARIFLDNIENIQASGAAQGLKVVQTALRFGANDVGPVTPEGGSASEEDARRIIRDAGFQPAQRDMAFRAMFLN